MQFTAYFAATRQRADRKGIALSWIQAVIDHPTHRQVQADGRIRLWAPVTENEGRFFARGFAGGRRDGSQRIF